MAIGTTAAILGSAAIGAGASMMGAKSQSKAAGQAAQAGEQAARETNALNRYIYDQSRQDNEPWRQAGVVGLNEYLANLGLGGVQQPQAQSPFSQFPTTTNASNPYQMGYEQGVPVGGAQQFAQEDSFRRYNSDRFGGGTGARNMGLAGNYQQTQTYQAPQQQSQQPSQGYNAQTQQNAFDKFRATPGYQFGLDEGRKAVEAGAAARGGLYSGAAMKALQKYGNDYADQQGYTPYINRLASLANIGQTTNQANANLGQNYAQQAGNALQMGANARISGLNAKANANANMWGNIAGFGGMALGQMGGLYGKQPEYF